ncbi:MAG: hypothetical protein BAA04_12200 [Firmicutes bacterium ZCTH02-B6]|nr:MAG: hypothetical protein BAA04_12200 [Firmicutes bacterium ZCTH02-B6]
MPQQRDDAPPTAVTDWAVLQPEQPVALRPESPLHKGLYQCSVLESSADRLRVTMPMDQGKLVLIPVGTPVVVQAETGNGTVTIQARVIDRQGGTSRSLLLGPLPQPPRYLGRQQPGTQARTIAITSGKGGVGKTALVVNLGVALSELGQRVCIVDGDLGTANVDVILNLAPRWNLAHVIAGEKDIYDVLVEGPSGVIILPGGSGLQELTALDDRQFAKLRSQFQRLERYTDILLLDTGSGLSRSVTNFILAADETLLITTPEPHAITDAYALLKVLAEENVQQALRLVVNRVRDAREGEEIARKMLFASQRFLGIELAYLGHVSDDPAVGAAIRRQQDLFSWAGRSRAAEDIRRLAARLLAAGGDAAPAAVSKPRSLVQRLRAMFGR